MFDWDFILKMMQKKKGASQGKLHPEKEKEKLKLQTCRTEFDSEIQARDDLAG